MPEVILKENQLIDDSWVFLADDQPVSDNVDSLVLPLERWLEESQRESGGTRATGVILKNTDSLDALIPELSHLQLICIEFPMAVDGRGYSQAHLLRNRHGYSNELRAVGEVLVDQLYTLKRVGFDSFALTKGQTTTCPSKYLSPFSVTYQ